MPRSLNRCALLLFLGVVLSLLLLVAYPTPGFAQSQSNWNPTSCEFQPPASDRRPTIEVIRQIQGGGSNITWDNYFLGLHRWNSNQWPAVDYLVDTTIAFRNGGVVSWVGWDGAGGGNSIIIDGTGVCQGWRQFIGHLSYDASALYQVGQEIGPNDVIGKPGCSGFENYCTDNSGSIPPHNHTTLGYWQNVFNFDDETVPVAVKGYWWIHPSRVEGSIPATSAPEPVVEESQESLNLPVEEYVTTSQLPDVAPVVKTSVLGQLLAPILPFRNLVIILTAILAVVFLAGIIYSDDFRQATIPFAAAIVVGVLFFFGLTRVNAASLSDLAPPRQNTSFITSTFGDDEDSYLSGVEAGENEEASRAPSGDCSLPLSYPDDIRRWCDYIEQYAAQYDLEPRFIAAIMVQESGGDPVIMSYAGAVGLLQVMPRDGISATFMCKNGPCFADRPSIAELKDPEFNIKYGTRMLRGLIDYYGSLREGLLHYGPSDVGYYYVDLVMAIYENYR